MSSTVRARADMIATFRYVAVNLMETLGRWVPSTPELEAKILFGKHLWELAQHADAFGKRTHELRLALQASRDPLPEFQDVLDRLAAADATGDRIAGLYDVLLPTMARWYREYLDTTDAMLDEPSVRVLERVLWDLERLDRERRATLEQRPDLDESDGAWLAELREAAEAADLVDYREDPAAATAGSA